MGPAGGLQPIANDLSDSSEYNIFFGGIIKPEYFISTPAL